MLNYGLITLLVIYQNEHCLHWLSTCLHCSFFVTKKCNPSTANKCVHFNGGEKNWDQTCKSQLNAIFHTKQIQPKWIDAVMTGFIESQSIIMKLHIHFPAHLIGVPFGMRCMFIEVFYLSIKSLHPHSRWFQRTRKKQTERKLKLQKTAADFELIEWNFVLFREFTFEIEFYYKTMDGLGAEVSIIFDFCVESFVNSFIVNNGHYFQCFEGSLPSNFKLFVWNDDGTKRFWAGCS